MHGALHFPSLPSTRRLSSFSTHPFPTIPHLCITSLSSLTIMGSRLLHILTMFCTFQPLGQNISFVSSEVRGAVRDAFNRRDSATNSSNVHELVIDDLKCLRTIAIASQSALCYIEAIRAKILELATSEAAGCSPREADQSDRVMFAAAARKTLAYHHRQSAKSR